MHVGGRLQHCVHALHSRPSGAGCHLKRCCAHCVQLISIANNSKERKFRQRADGLPTPKLLARVEQLRLLSKLEELKLLSLLQNNGEWLLVCRVAVGATTRPCKSPCTSAWVPIVVMRGTSVWRV